MTKRTDLSLAADVLQGPRQNHFWHSRQTYERAGGGGLGMDLRQGWWEEVAKLGGRRPDALTFKACTAQPLHTPSGHVQSPHAHATQHCTHAGLRATRHSLYTTLRTTAHTYISSLSNFACVLGDSC